jgi:hypothetical protein
MLNHKEIGNNASLGAGLGIGDAKAHVMIQTTMGDIYVQLFDKECPRTCENFLTHSKTGYY